MLIPWVMFLLFYFLLSGWSQMCNSIPNLSTACRGSIVEVAKITSVSMKTNQYSVTRSIGTWKYATRPHCLRNLISVVLKNIGRKTKKKKKKLLYLNAEKKRSVIYLNLNLTNNFYNND